MFKAKIDNKVVSVKIIDSNYNNNSKEVQIIEGTHKGRCTIVNNNDIVIDTYKQLLQLCKLDIAAEDIEQSHFTELISQATYNTIKGFSQRYTLTNNEYYKLLEHYKYQSCNDIDEVKLMILIDSLQNSIDNIRSSFTSIKNRALKEV